MGVTIFGQCQGGNTQVGIWVTTVFCRYSFVVDYMVTLPIPRDTRYCVFVCLSSWLCCMRTNSIHLHTLNTQGCAHTSARICLHTSVLNVRSGSTYVACEVDADAVLSVRPNNEYESSLPLRTRVVEMRKSFVVAASVCVRDYVGDAPCDVR